MKIKSQVGRRRFASRALLAPLSLAIATTIVVGTFSWAEPTRIANESASAIVFRAKPSMSRQPRPLSAPLRHLDQRVDAAVVLLGIEAIDDSESAAFGMSKVGDWTPRR